MEVVAFVGSTGTGKSYKAFLVARDRGIEYIIDDGLLIGGSRIIAGTSAKRENTKVASVKRALISDESHREEIKEALEEEGVEKLLIIGTSVKMTDRIRTALDLPEIKEIIYITDIATPEEIECARNTRKNEGKHVIPVPHVEVRKAFSGYFLDSLKVFRKKGKHADFIEKTIIRPSYSYMGKYDISVNALNQLTEMSALNVSGVAKVYRCRAVEYGDGLKLDLELELFFVPRLDLLALKIQTECGDAMNKMTGLNVYGVKVNIKGLKITRNKNE